LSNHHTLAAYLSVLPQAVVSWRIAEQSWHCHGREAGWQQLTSARNSVFETQSAIHQAATTLA